MVQDKTPTQIFDQMISNVCNQAQFLKMPESIDIAAIKKKAGIPWFRISTPFHLVAGGGLEPPTSGL